MAKKAAPVITPEQLEAGVQRNENEYIARVQALRAMHEQGTFNPPSDPAVLAKQASEAMRGATGGPAMNPARDNTFNLRDRAPDRQAESIAKSKGWDGHAKEEAKDEGGQESQDAPRDGGVQAGQASFGQQARPQSPFAQAGHSDSTSPVWIERTYEGKTKEEVSELIPADAKAVTYVRVWKATALVRQG